MYTGRESLKTYTANLIQLMQNVIVNGCILWKNSMGTPPFLKQGAGTVLHAPSPLRAW